MNLHEYLNQPRPQTRLNWEGKPVPIEWPKGKIIARCGEAYIFQVSTHHFSTVYGLQVENGQSLNTAAASFGRSCIHQAECEGIAKLSH